MTDTMERLRELDTWFKRGMTAAPAPWNGTVSWAIAEIERLREILNRRHIDPDRCQEYPKGEQCALKHGHEGGHKWARGD